MVLNRITTIFNEDLTGTDLSDSFTIPEHVNYIVISSKRDKPLWLCNESGQKLVLLPNFHGEIKYTFAELKITGTYKLQPDTSSSGAVYVAAFHGV